MPSDKKKIADPDKVYATYWEANKQLRSSLFLMMVLLSTGCVVAFLSSPQKPVNVPLLNLELEWQVAVQFLAVLIGFAQLSVCSAYRFSRTAALSLSEEGSLFPGGVPEEAEFPAVHNFTRLRPDTKGGTDRITLKIADLAYHLTIAIVPVLIPVAMLARLFVASEVAFNQMALETLPVLLLFLFLSVIAVAGVGVFKPRQ